MKRPGKEMGKDDMDESEKDDDDDDDDDDEMKKPMEGKGPWKKFGGKLKKMYGKIDKKPKGLFTGIWNKMKSFGKKVASKFRGKFGKKPRFGMYRHHHRRRPHHHHGPPPPFRRVRNFVTVQNAQFLIDSLTHCLIQDLCLIKLTPKYEVISRLVTEKLGQACCIVYRYFNLLYNGLAL